MQSQNDNTWENTIGETGLLVFMHEENADALIPVAKAASMLNLSDSRVYQLVSEGQLIGIKIHSSLLVFINTVRNYKRLRDKDTHEGIQSL